VAFLLLLSAAVCGARAGADANSPAFTNVPELTSGFHSLYLQNFTEAREKFSGWESQHPDEPLGEVALAASYLFEEFYRQGVLSSDFFLNEKRFLHGIEGKPDPARMKSFQEAIRQARKLARQRLEKDARDPEGLFALALSAGMEIRNPFPLRTNCVSSDTKRAVRKFIGGLPIKPATNRLAGFW